MQTETREEASNAGTPDLIDLNTPIGFFHNPGASQRTGSTESDITSTSGKEYNGFLKSAMVAASQSQERFQKLSFARSLSNQSNISCETVKMRNGQNEPLSDISPNVENQGVQKLVSFVGDDQYPDRFFLIPGNFKDKKETDGESSELSFGCPSIERFRMTEDHSFIQSSVIDQDLERVESLLKGWTSDLKKKILGEFSQSKIRSLEYYRKQIAVVKEKHDKEVKRFQEENDSYRELVKNFEKSLEIKDESVSKLSATIKSYENKMALQKYFSDWKIKQNEAERERFTSSLAFRHYHHALMGKVWKTWHSNAESSSRLKREKACQVEDQEFIIEGLRKDYEERLNSMKESLEQSKKEIERLNKLRENLEEDNSRPGKRVGYRHDFGDASTSLYHERGISSAERLVRSDGAKDIYLSHIDLMPHQTPPQSNNHSLQMYLTSHHDEPTYFSDPNPPIKKATAQHKKLTLQHLPNRIKAHLQTSKPKQVKVIPVKRTNAMTSTLLGSSLAPPMASVVVERHHPINKETMGQALSCKYPVDVMQSRAGVSLKKGRATSQLIRVIN